MQTKERKYIEKSLSIYTLLIFAITAILIGKLAWMQPYKPVSDTVCQSASAPVSPGVAFAGIYLRFPPVDGFVRPDMPGMSGSQRSDAY